MGWPSAPPTPKGRRSRKAVHSSGGFPQLRWGLRSFTKFRYVVIFVHSACLGRFSGRFGRFAPIRQASRLTDAYREQNNLSWHFQILFVRGIQFVYLANGDPTQEFEGVLRCRALYRFSRAADENHISQSGAQPAGAATGRRAGRKADRPLETPFRAHARGRSLLRRLPRCRRAIHFAVEDRVRTLHEEVAGHVRVASIYSVGLHHMNRHLQDFLSQHPRANVRLEYLHPHRVYQSVEDDLADLGLVSYPKSSRTLTAIPWREEPMVLVTAPGHPLAKRTRVGLEELNGEKMVGFDADLTIRREIDRALGLHGAEVRVVMEFDNIETIKRAIEIDAGVALLPEPTVMRGASRSSLAAVPLDTDELVRPLGIIHRRGKELEQHGPAISSSYCNARGTRMQPTSTDLQGLATCRQPTATRKNHTASLGNGPTAWPSTKRISSVALGEAAGRASLVSRPAKAAGRCMLEIPPGKRRRSRAICARRPATCARSVCSSGR